MIKNLILDWSGTISNDFAPVYEATMMVFQTLGVPRIPVDEYREEFVLPVMDFYNKYIPTLTHAEADRLFQAAFALQPSPQIYPTAKQTLKELESGGIQKVVLSAHFQHLLEKEAKAYGVNNLFKEIVGGVNDKRQVIEEVLQRNGFDPAETGYVGDMVHDIVAGKKVGVKTIGITWGYQSERRLMTAKPDVVIPELSGLLGLVVQG